MVGLRRGRAVAASLGGILVGIRVTVAATLAGLAFGAFAFGGPAMASTPVACAPGITSASQLSPGVTCQLQDGTIISGSTSGSQSGGSGANTVNYGNANRSVQTAIMSPLENAAATLRMVFGGLALLAIVLGLILRNMHHNLQLAQVGARMVTVSFEGLIVLAILPFVLNLLIGWNIPFA